MTKLSAALALTLFACSPDPIVLCTDPPDAGPQCIITGGPGVTDCSQCTEDFACRSTACGYCNRYNLTGPSVPVHRYNGLWCIGGEGPGGLDTETDRVDCSACVP